MNTNATKLIEVYDLDDLVSMEILESLNEDAMKVLGTNSQDSLLVLTTKKIPAIVLETLNGRIFVYSQI